jgi:5-(hydroxymethyl)furfural/furfural oxidase
VYDHIIVGGGSAGSVQAQRLSAKSANKILICELAQNRGSDIDKSRP